MKLKPIQFASPQLPFREATGLSLNYIHPIPKQLGLFVDGNFMGTLTRFNGNYQKIEYVDYTTNALPYKLIKSPSVLLLGLGGDSGILQALYHHAKLIRVVEPNPQLIKLMLEVRFAGVIYRMISLNALCETKKGLK